MGLGVFFLVGVVIRSVGKVCGLWKVVVRG